MSTELSKLISYILRHNPEKFGLTPDEEGFVLLDGLLPVLHRETNQPVSKQDLEELNEKSARKRFQISGNKIKALYGHSKKIKVTYPTVKPPAILFHGTTPNSLPLILRDGLKPMQRNFVHLTVAKETAVIIASRRTKEPVILSINAEKAWEQGINFYQGGKEIYLADYIPPELIGEDREYSGSENSITK